MTSIVSPGDAQIHMAAELVRKGELVGMPTETVYGLAADATNAEAIAAVFAAKGRPSTDPLIAHVTPSMWQGQPPLVALRNLGVIASENGDLRLLGPDGAPSPFAEAVEKVMRALWPGALTLILPRGHAIPPRASSGKPSIAVRCPAHSVAQRLIEAVGRPLVAPSANRFGRISPTTAQAVADELGDAVSLVLDGGPSTLGLESTVLWLGDRGQWRILRSGMTPREALAEILGADNELQDAAYAHSRDLKMAHSAPSPGTLPSHYAPRARLMLVPWSQDARIFIEAVEHAAVELACRSEKRGVALLSFLPDTPQSNASLESAVNASCLEVQQSINLGDNDAVAAHALFSTLRTLDACQPALIVAQTWPKDAGYGAAINDRLTRAAAPRPSG